MANTEDLTSQLYSVLSNISHPIEGTFYLFLLAVIFRWRWPKAWNNFLNSVSAEVETSLNKNTKPIRSKSLQPNTSENEES